MKKLVSLLLCTALLLPAGALAAGKATVTEEIFLTRKVLTEWAACDVYAEIENTGDKAIVMDGGLIELFDPNEEVIVNEDLMYAYPEVLAPGEKGYAYFSKTFMEIPDPAQLADYSLTVNAKSAKDETVERLTAGDATCGVEERTTYTSEYALTTTVKNDLDHTVSNIRVVFIGRDAAGKLMYVNSVEADNVGLMPGSSIEVKNWEDSLSTQWKDNEAAPATVEAIAYGQ